MNLLEIIDALKGGLMWIGLGVLLLIAAACAFVGLRRVSRVICRLDPAVLGAFAVVAIFATGLAQKRMLQDGGSGNPALPSITAEVIAQGWRVESVTTNDAISYAMPTNGVEYAPWSLRGGRETHFPLDLGDFAFPFGTGMVHRLDVLSGGMVESLPRQRAGCPLSQYSSIMSICAAREWASVVPGVGRFWWADTARPESAPYRSKLLTWENVFAGRDCTGQYNAQIELWSDGNFIMRSNNVERICRRVLPFDFDNDGLPNDIDPAPETPLVPSAWNQSEEWAASAFPSNAADIAAMGGYAAWVAAHGTEPDRRLVSLGVSFDDGSAWPALLNFGGVPVVADGGEQLAFAVDCGAKVPFSLTAGRLGSLAVTATEPPTRSGEGMTTIEDNEFHGNYGYPHERIVNDVMVHLDDSRTGWLCRIAGVSVDDDLAHLHPGDSAVLTAEVSDCHSNAYIGCTWAGGEGLQFSDEHALSTTVTYDSSSAVEWATNGIDLITQFVGYSLTNHVNVTVGVQTEPSLGFSLGCQEVFFLNDADFLEGECPSNRPERIRPVSLNLIGPLGTNGTARLSVGGSVNPVVFHVVNGVTNRVTSETEIPLAVTNDFEHTGSYTVYVSCPELGSGTITATFTPADGGEPLTDSVTFRCIEPLRKLVTTEKKNGRYVNPSRLVMGTNAVLKVGAKGPFSPSEVEWRLISGSAQVVPNGWLATVTPTGAAGDVVVVEARFNDDEIQPRFVLPVIQPRTIPVKAFVVEPPEKGNLDVEQETNNVNTAWTAQEICKMLDTANETFTQVGIEFKLVGQPTTVGTTNDWNLGLGKFVITNGKLKLRCSPACVNLLNSYTALNCIELYFIGSIVFSSPCIAINTPYGIIIGKKDVTTTTLAHELGHALGLDDCYVRMDDGITSLPGIEEPVDGPFFINGSRDWGGERGRGFYGTEDSKLAVAGRLLMHGVSSNDRTDIPDGMVLSLTRAMTNGTPGTFNAKVGAWHFKKTTAEVYSR